jgi:hypothetical protein
MRPKPPPFEGIGDPPRTSQVLATYLPGAKEGGLYEDSLWMLRPRRSRRCGKPRCAHENARLKLLVDSGSAVAIREERLCQINPK